MQLNNAHHTSWETKHSGPPSQISSIPIICVERWMEERTPQWSKNFSLVNRTLDDFYSLLPIYLHLLQSDFLRKITKLKGGCSSPPACPEPCSACLCRLSPLPCLSPQDKFDPFFSSSPSMHYAVSCQSYCLPLSLPASQWHLHFLHSASATTTCVYILFPMRVKAPRKAKIIYYSFSFSGKI